MLILNKLREEGLKIKKLLNRSLENLFNNLIMIKDKVSKQQFNKFHEEEVVNQKEKLKELKDFKLHLSLSLISYSNFLKKMDQLELKILLYKMNLKYQNNPSLKSKHNLKDHLEHNKKK